MGRQLIVDCGGGGGGGDFSAGTAVANSIARREAGGSAGGPSPVRICAYTRSQAGIARVSSCAEAGTRRGRQQSGARIVQRTSCSELCDTGSSSVTCPHQKLQQWLDLAQLHLHPRRANCPRSRASEPTNGRHQTSKFSSGCPGDLPWHLARTLLPLPVPPCSAAYPSAPAGRCVAPKSHDRRQTVRTANAH